MMDDYKPNSHRFKEEQTLATANKRKVEKVVTGKVKTKKKSEMHKVKDIFISEDAANIKSYVLMDVLVPAIKKAISDIVVNGIDMLLYGETNRPARKSNVDYVSYDRFSDPRDSRRPTVRISSGYNFDDIILESRGEAEGVLNGLYDLIDTYGEASVADLYDLIGVTGNYTDNKYGWTNLRNAKAIHTRDGYILDLPKARPLK